MKNLKNPRWMWLKASLFLVIGFMSAGMILMRDPRWEIAVLLMLCVWAFCRAYYFVFYVIEHYIDPNHRFSGLMDFVRYMFGKKKGQEREE